MPPENIKHPKYWRDEGDWASCAWSAPHSSQEPHHKTTHEVQKQCWEEFLYLSERLLAETLREIVCTVISWGKKAVPQRLGGVVLDFKMMEADNFVLAWFNQGRLVAGSSGFLKDPLASFSDFKPLSQHKGIRTALQNLHNQPT